MTQPLGKKLCFWANTKIQVVIFGVQYLDGLIVGECFIGPSPDAPDAFDGSDPIVGDEY